MTKTVQNDFGNTVGVGELVELLINEGNYKVMK